MKTEARAKVCGKARASTARASVCGGAEMKTLAFYDRKNYDPASPRFVRNAAKAIVIDGGKIAMLRSDRHGIYAFPGGGVEGGETLIDALVREVEEETDLTVMRSSIAKFGKTVEIRKDLRAGEIFEHRKHFYFCDVESASAKPRLTKEETESGYRLAFAAVDEAIAANELHMRQRLDGKRNARAEAC